MNPKRRRDISVIAAKEMKLPVEHVDDIIATYYSYTTKVLSSLKYPHVRIKGLGIFSVNEGKIKKHMKTIHSFVDNMDEAETFSQYQKKIALSTLAQSYERLLELLDDEKKRKLAVRKKQKEYYENKCN